jgi:hypothetical protein
MSVTNTYTGVADGDSRTNGCYERTAAAADSRQITGQVANEVLVAGEVLGVDEFIAGVLRRAHQGALQDDAHDEARAILGVAHLFADDLQQTGLPFDRLRFIEAATADLSDA